MLWSFATVPTPVSRNLSTGTSAEHSFTVSYLINSCGFSPEDALKAFNSRRVRLKTSEKPDSVLASFRNRGFSESEIRSIITKEPRILLCKFDKSVLPKFEFLLSRGVSFSDIVHIVVRSPKFLTRSVENHIIPSYELLKRFFQSDKDIISCMTFSIAFTSPDHVPVNVKLLLDKGVAESNIKNLFRGRPSLFRSYDLGQSVEEVEKLTLRNLALEHHWWQKGV
ncbi:hypothetical protein L6164_025476 [Bauhinia variegata]|uniref:Uncharacterized protein n=1 Tax=Bauhinia variegata TaxID=167791 RepID=A0ACB9M0Y6_BAUVA|nr:hypothetical protein L6164_025476 [Bauhinia variegata]